MNNGNPSLSRVSLAHTIRYQNNAPFTTASNSVGNTCRQSAMKKEGIQPHNTTTDSTKATGNDIRVIRDRNFIQRRAF